MSMENYSIRLSKQDAAFLKRLGSRSLINGIRRAVLLLRKLDNPPEDISKHPLKKAWNLIRKLSN